VFLKLCAELWFIGLQDWLSSFLQIQSTPLPRFRTVERPLAAVFSVVVIVWSGVGSSGSFIALQRAGAHGCHGDHVTLATSSISNSSQSVAGQAALN